MKIVELVTATKIEEQEAVTMVREVVTETVLVDLGGQGPRGPMGPAGDALANFIDDTEPLPNKAYSGQRTEERLGEDVDAVETKIGDEEFNFALLFDNKISQGN